MDAASKQSHPVDTAAWPTMQQMIALSIARAEMGLVALI